MNKHFEALHELHHKHLLTHKVLSLVGFTIIVMLAVYGLSRVKAEQSIYVKVPNGDVGVCFKEGGNFNDPSKHVSCKTHEPVCQTNFGTLIGCKTGILITD
ncbi:MAG: hypothetical protein WCO35_03730 [Candidatus Nomurabacteria bacterium]